MAIRHLGNVALCAIFGVITAPAATLRVGKQGTPCDGARFTTIQSAVDAAAVNDVVGVCPALYAEQVLIKKPLTVEGIAVAGIGRVLLQPTSMLNVGGVSGQAVIAVMMTGGVTLRDLELKAILWPSGANFGPLNLSDSNP